MTLATANGPKSDTEFGGRSGAARVRPVQTGESRAYPLGVAGVGPAETAAPRTDAHQHGREGFFSGTAHGLRDLLFELGLFGPSTLWYPSSETLSSREKLDLDIQLRGINL